MLTYNPNEDMASTPISMTIEEELARQPEPEAKGVPTGLLMDSREKKIDESQMADFSSSIDDVIQGPGQMLQDEVQGSAYAIRPAPSAKTSQQGGGSSSSKNPFGLNDDQYFAALAGVAAVIAFSKPVQDKLSTMVPKFLGENGTPSLTGLAVTALIAAILFYFARKFLTEK